MLSSQFSLAHPFKGTFLRTNLMFITALTLCTFAACNTYVADVASSSQDCAINSTRLSVTMANAWEDEKMLAETLESFNIYEHFSNILSYNVSCEETK